MNDQLTSCCGAIDLHFSATKAEGLENELKSKGPPAETQLLLDSLRRADVTGMTVLDVGAGIGVLSERLLAAGARSAVLVDISTAYLKAAEARLAQTPFVNSVQYRQADIIEVAAELADADIVTLDKVICCYPNWEELVNSSTRKAKRFYAASYPRRRIPVRLAIWFENFMRTLRGNPFRAFVHPVTSIEALIERNGFERLAVQHTFFWRCAVYRRK